MSPHEPIFPSAQPLLGRSHRHLRDNFSRMYNLLVTAAEGAWDLPAYEYDRTRFLEHTTDSLKAKFAKLDAAALEELRSLPTLFTYEGDNEVVRVGYIRRIRERGRSILIEYEFDDNVPPFTFAELEPLKIKLDIRGWNTPPSRVESSSDRAHHRFVARCAARPLPISFNDLPLYAALRVRARLASNEQFALRKKRRRFRSSTRSVNGMLQCSGRPSAAKPPVNERTRCGRSRQGTPRGGPGAISLTRHSTNRAVEQIMVAPPLLRVIRVKTREPLVQNRAACDGPYMLPASESIRSECRAKSQRKLPAG
jgi:hypothetical protein